jgi:hypothetical protein
MSQQVGANAAQAFDEVSGLMARLRQKVSQPWRTADTGISWRASNVAGGRLPQSWPLPADVTGVKRADVVHSPQTRTNTVCHLACCFRDGADGTA